MKTSALLSFVAASGWMLASAFGITIISDNFDSGTLSAEWASKAGATNVAGGVGGSASFARILQTATGLGDSFGGGGAESFVIDYYFRVANDSVNRQFNLGISSGATTPNPGFSAMNLRYEGGNTGTFALYGTAWNPISLGSIIAGEWYRMQVEGTGWGTSSGSYTLRLSDAGGSTFTKSVTQTIVQNGSITGPFNTTNPTASYPGTAQSFIFTSLYGLSPGFDLDNVMVTGTLVPEPAGLMLGALSVAIGALRRRR